MPQGVDHVNPDKPACLTDDRWKALKLHTVESVVDNYLESNSAKGKSVLEVLDYLFDQEAKSRLTTVA